MSDRYAGTIKRVPKAVPDDARTGYVGPALAVAPMPRSLARRHRPIEDGHMWLFVTRITGDHVWGFDVNGRQWVFERGVWVGSRIHGRGDAYRFDQIRVGDQIRVSYVTTPDATVALSVCIMRRPGGRIPEEERVRPDDPDYLAWHKVMQKQQDEEEKGHDGRLKNALWDAGGRPQTSEAYFKALIEQGVYTPPPKSTELVDLPQQNRQPGVVNGIVLSPDVIYKAVLEKEGSLKSPPPSPPPKGPKQ